MRRASTVRTHSRPAWAPKPSRSCWQNMDLEDTERQGSERGTGNRHAARSASVLIKRLEVVEAFRMSGQQARVDDYGRHPGHPAGHPPHGAAGRRPLCHQRLERPVPPRHQPQQPPQAAAGAGRAGHHCAQRKAHAAGGGGRPDRQRPPRPPGDGPRQPPAEDPFRTC